jgi:hypothetical protein
MLRALQNVDPLITRLRELGYTFDTQSPRRPLTSAELRQLEILDASYGPLPLALRSWYQVVGRVRLTGSHPWLKDRYILELAPDDCHKAGLSGGGPYDVGFRNLPWTPSSMAISATGASWTVCGRCSAGVGFRGSHDPPCSRPSS